MTQGLPFHKIPMDISFSKKSRKGRPVIRYGAIAYYTTLGLPFPYEQLKVLQPDAVRWVEITGGDQVSPHRDHTTICALNCYFEAGGATTHFWKPTPNTVPTRFPGAATSNLYKDGELDHVGQFTAQDGDAYLLNVSEIHSVDRTPFVNRRFIQLSWKTVPYEQVLERVLKLYEPDAV